MAVPQFRHEFKYLIHDTQLPVLLSRVRPLMTPDPHAGSDGAYLIRSLYFDTLDDRCFFENEDGTDPREKYRLRIYNHSASRIALECKRKEHGMTQKSACLVSRDQAQCLIDGSPLPLASDLSTPPLLRKLDVMRRTEGMHPVVIVEYERRPFICREGNVRVTFDLNISSAAPPSRFFDPVISRRPVLPAGLQLMEVKYDTFLPDVIYHSLNLGSLRQTSFSKYYLCRKYSF